MACLGIGELGNLLGNGSSLYSFSTIFKINLALTWTALTFQCSDNLKMYTQTLIFHTGKQYVKLIWGIYSKKQETQLDL